jgi:indole-3-glycerol phosphate synthase
LKSDPRPVALIAEVKQASPSQGMIRPGFDALQVATTYAEVGATCLSVLTDEKYFRGSPRDLQAVRAVVDLPILRKDFVLDRYQLLEARVWGADCVLLIVAAFTGSHPLLSGGLPLLRDLYGEAKALGLDVLVEVHDMAETEVALELRADLIGVNNRNLITFQTDLSASEFLLPKIVPHATSVAESALSSHADVARVQAAGARAVLIGTAFCGSPDIATAVTGVMGW